MTVQTGTHPPDPGGTPHLLEPTAYQCHGNNVGPMGTLRTGNGHLTDGVPFLPIPVGCDLRNGSVTGGVAQTLQSHHQSNSLNAEPTVIVPIDMRQASRGELMTNNRTEDLSSGGVPGTGIGRDGDPSPSLGLSHTPAVAIRTNQTGANGPLSRPIPIQNATRGKDQNGLGVGEPDSPMYTLDNASHHAVAWKWSVRRLTPLECERLMGLPDHYTLVPYRGKQATDGNRYKAIGNSMAVNCMRWLGHRIQMVETIQNECNV